MAKLNPMPRIGTMSGNLSAWGIEVDMDPSLAFLIASFNKLGLDIRSFKEPLHRSIKEVMSPSLRQNFDSGGRPKKWKKLRPATIAKKTWLGQRAPESPLIGTGRLRTVVGQIGIWQINGPEGYAAINTLKDADYGLYHQEGAEGTPIGIINKVTGVIEEGMFGGLPERPFLLFQKKDEADIERIFIRWFQERAMKTVGFRPGATGAVI